MAKLRFGLVATLLASSVLLWTSNVDALESGQVKTSNVTATFVTNTDVVKQGEPFEAGLYLKIAPGWHTYWKNPGDAGVAPELDVQHPADTVVGSITWPTPERIAEGDLTTFAYRGNVLLPVRITPGRSPLTLAAHASWLVCRDICVPEEGDFTLALPAGTPAASPQSALFTAAASGTPVAAPFQSHISPDGVLSLSGPGLPGDITKAEFFPTAAGQVETIGPQQPERRGERLSLRLGLGSSHPADAPLDGVVAFTDGSGAKTAFEISAAPGPTMVATPPRSLVPVLLGALGGGLLLNLMPCVFPVLAMKALALARLAAADRRAIRLEAGSYTVGVLVAFTALGGLLLAFRSAGQAVSWGFQFQSPLFVTAIAWLLLATGLNMSGVFSVGERMSGLGQSLASRRGQAGSFFTGLLAVVVATPCTASFMGAALAAAFAAPAPVALLVFATMGLGLALPYAAIAALPGLATLLPRPGGWMVTLRQALAFPMYGAAVWLVWVVSQQTGPAGVLVAGIGLVGTAFAAWALGAAQAGRGRGRLLGYIATAVAGIATVALLSIPTGPAAEASEPFTPARLAELRGEGRPVFVNMTAAWCLSCLVNERIALSPAAVQAAFAHAHVAYLKGDWTRQDPAISTFLRDHDRDGVPLYVFYAPGQPPVIMPQLLSEGTLLDQIAKLGG